jgi:putative transposase
MGQKHHKPEEIIGKLRQVEVLTGQGKPVAEAVRAIGVTEPTYYRWRSEVGPGEASEAARAGERPPSEGGGGSDAEEAGAQGSRCGKLVSAARRRACVEHVTAKLGVSERFACKVLKTYLSRLLCASKWQFGQGLSNP